MSKTLKRYCSINKFLEKKNPKFYELVHEVCIPRLFSPGRGPGITLLMPDAALLKKIEAKVYGDSPSEAVDLLKALVIKDYLPTPADFMKKRDDIPNALRQKIVVSSADAKTIKLASGGVLVKNKNFVPLKTRENMAVYDLTKSLIPTDGKASEGKYIRKGDQKKTGGATINRTANAKKVFLNVCSAGWPELALTRVVSYIEHVRHNTSKDSPDVLALEALCDCNPLSSYLVIFQPYRGKKTWISDIDYNKWMSESSGGLCVCADPVAVFKGYAKDSPATEKIADMQRSMVAEKGAKPVLARAISKALKSISVTGKLKGVCVFGSSKRSAVYKNNPNLLGCEAELRMWISVALSDAKSGNYSAKSMFEIMTFVQLYLNLDAPWIMLDQAEVNATRNAAYFYSSTYSLARSDVLVWSNRAPGGSWKEISDPTSEYLLDTQSLWCNSISDNQAELANKQELMIKSLKSLAARIS